ncbi:hypothetical protein ACLBUO_31110, partial [Pseudomonas aeruginosa]
AKSDSSVGRMTPTASSMPVGARPAAPNPMEMEEQQAPADAPPVEGGFDAAPPAQ